MTANHRTLERCLKEGRTIYEQLQLAASYLQAEGVDEARENAELLLLHVLKLERAQLLLQWRDIFPSEVLPTWGECLQRKGNGEPVQYIIGRAWFYGRSFEVSPAVLIPRPETELLVEAILQQAMPWEKEALNVLDVGTGSGAIAVTLASERPEWNVIASDLSPAALGQAKENARQLGVLERMTWVEGDLLEPFNHGQALTLHTQSIDILVSNPPYIPQRDMEGLQREVKDYEPHLALVGGVDGLDPYRIMLDTLSSLKQKPRLVAFELGIHQPVIVAEMLRELQAWDEVHIIRDYAGIERHVLAIKK